MPEPKSSKIIPLRPADGLRDRPDDDLMKLAAAGRRDAFSVLVERHGARVFRLCMRLTGWDAPLSEELAQEVWVAVWASRARYEPSGEFSAWLLSAARNRCSNARRDQMRRTRVLTNEAAPDVTTTSSGVEPAQLDEILAREDQRRLQAAIEVLPPQLREAVALRFGDALPYDAIAKAVGANESTVRSRVFHALKKLRGLLEPSQGESQ